MTIDHLCKVGIYSLVERHFEFNKMDILGSLFPLILTVNITMIFEVFSLQKKSLKSIEKRYKRRKLQKWQNLYGFPGMPFFVSNSLSHFLHPNHTSHRQLLRPRNFILKTGYRTYMGIQIEGLIQIKHLFFRLFAMLLFLFSIRKPLQYHTIVLQGL